MWVFFLSNIKKIFFSAALLLYSLVNSSISTYLDPNSFLVQPNLDLNIFPIPNRILFIRQYL